MRKLLTTAALIGLTFGFSGCCHGPNCPNSAYKHWDLDSRTWNPTALPTINMVINDIANQLFKDSRLDNNMGSIAITTFVDLDNFDKTTHFGRVLSESMYNELYKRGLQVHEFRGQKNITVNKNGEYFISRNYKKIKKRFLNKYILVGTYASFGKGYLINARIIDNATGRLVASSRSIYNNSDCSLSEYGCDGRFIGISSATTRCEVKTKSGCPTGECF